jgi:hypothetical protein
LLVEVTNTSCTEDILSISGFSVITVQNNLTLANGFVNGAAISVNGNTTVLPGFDGGSTGLIFSGTANQNFDLTGAVSNFNGNVTLNKGSGTVQLLSACQLDAPGQSFTLINGVLVTSSTNLLTIGDNVSVSGGSSSAYVSGPIRKVGNDAFTFPTGKSGIYSPIRISAPASVSDAFEAEYFLNLPTNDGYDINIHDPLITDVSACDYWILNRTAGTSNVTVTLTWNRATGCYGFSNTAILTVARWDGTQWTNAGVTGTTDSGMTGTVTSALVTSFSPFAVASTSSPLPVELKSFTGRWLGRLVQLEWITASELNNDYFEVERSTDGQEFSVLGRVDGSGTVNTEMHYSFIDEDPLPGISYYRLRQVDFNGSHEYSRVISLVNPNEPSDFEVYPNPAQGDRVSFNAESTVDVFNALHQYLFSCQRSKELDISNLASGVYYLRNHRGEMLRLVVVR